jgi:hypothetical protein
MRRLRRRQLLDGNLSRDRIAKQKMTSRTKTRKVKFTLEEAKAAWDDHLAGSTVAEIAYYGDRSVRWIRYLITSQRAKYPLSVEHEAMKALVRRMVDLGFPFGSIGRRVYEVFRRRCCPESIAQICGRQVTCPKTGKTYTPAAKLKKKAVKPVKKPALAVARKKLPAAKAPVVSLGVTTQADKAAFKKEARRLQRREGSAEGKKVTGTQTLEVLAAEEFTRFISKLAEVPTSMWTRMPDRTNAES